MAMRFLEHPDAEKRAPSLALARAMLALVAVEHGQLGFARGHAEKAKAAAGRVGHPPELARRACVHRARPRAGEPEGKLAEAERELSFAEHLSRDEVAAVHHAWLLVLIARIRVRRGRLDEAQATLARAPGRNSRRSGTADACPALADEVARELEAARTRTLSGEVLDPPSEAELAVLRLMAADLSTREVGERLFLSPNTIRSHTRALYRKLGVNSRGDMVAKATALGLLEQPESSG